MIKLLKHHRIHIPNSLAMLAALVLVVSSVVGFETRQEVYSSAQASTPSAQADNTGTDSIGNSADAKPRGISIGSLLFRRR
jgi:hypothetical protein